MELSSLAFCKHNGGRLVRERMGMSIVMKAWFVYFTYLGITRKMDVCVRPREQPNAWTDSKEILHRGSSVRNVGRVR